MLKRIATALIAISCLSSCGTTAPNSDVGIVHTGFDGRRTVPDNVAVTITETGPPLSAAAVRVSGHSCKNKMWDPAPSRDNAIALMKNDAAKQGFNAIHSVQVISDPAALAKNCWEALIATGIAFHQSPLQSK